jgi:hypothetical protein
MPNLAGWPSETLLPPCCITLGACLTIFGSHSPTISYARITAAQPHRPDLTRRRHRYSRRPMVKSSCRPILSGDSSQLNILTHRHSFSWTTSPPHHSFRLFFLDRLSIEMYTLSINLIAHAIDLTIRLARCQRKPHRKAVKPSMNGRNQASVVGMVALLLAVSFAQGQDVRNLEWHTSKASRRLPPCFFRENRFLKFG